jgi:hypothetical protein
MSTVNTSSNAELYDLKQSRRTLGIGLLLGTITLFVFSSWMSARGLSGWLSTLCGILGGVSFVMAVWNTVDFGKEPTAEARIARFKKEKTLFGPILIAAGVVLVVLGIGLFFGEKLRGIGESVGLFIMGVIALFSGSWLREKREESLQTKFLETLVRKRAGISYCLLGIGLAFFIFGLALRYQWDAAVPQWFGAMLLGIIGIGAGLYLSVAAEFDVARARYLAIFGLGLFGFAIAVITLAQAWQWREVFFGGLPAWKGEEAWKFWLSAYVELAGLAIMFGSVLLGRSEMRLDPLLRRLLFGYNAVLTGLLLLAVLVVLNIVVYAVYPLTFEWSASRGLYALSDSSIGILEKMQKPAKVYVLVSQMTTYYNDLHNLLDNCQAITDKLEVEYISPDKDIQKYDALARRYPEILPDVKTAFQDDMVGRGVLVVYGPEAESPKDKQPPHAFIPVRQLVEEKKKSFHEINETVVFQGENALMTEMRFLMEGQKKTKIYVLQGNGELSLGKGKRRSRQGQYAFPLEVLSMSNLVDQLKKESYDIHGLSFAESTGKDDPDVLHVKPSGKDQRKEVPEDASVVVIAGASRELPKDTLDALERYMNKDGRLVVLADIVVDPKFTEMKSTGLEAFLKKYNVQLNNDFAFRLVTSPNDPFPSTMIVATPPESVETLLAKKFLTKLFFMESVRAVKPLKDAMNWKAETILAAPRLEIRPLLDQNFVWAEGETSALFNQIQFGLMLARTGKFKSRLGTGEAVPVAVGVKDDKDRPRIVVVGDAELASDLFIAGRSDIVNGELNFSFLASTLDWLLDRPSVGIRPKEAGTYSLDANLPRGPMVLIPGWIFVFTILSLGTGIWVVRRR